METEILTPAQIRAHNKELLARLNDHELGEVKFASAAGSKMLKRRIYEEGFLRRILPEETVTDDDLTPQVSSEYPTILKEMEGLSKGAKSVPFGDSPDIESYRGDKYLCMFNTITTPDYTKDLNELRTYQGDLRQLVTNNSLIHMQTEEDAQFIATVNSIVGNPGSPSPVTGNVQSYSIDSGIGRTTFPDICKILPAFNLNTGVALMNKSTALEFTKWTRDQVGGDLAEKIMPNGSWRTQTRSFRASQQPCKRAALSRPSQTSSGRISLCGNCQSRRPTFPA